MDKNYFQPKITVIMPVFNGEKYIGTAIDSILNQTFTNFEFLIIDDCSSDKSLKIIKSYNDQRIKLIRNDINIGVTKTKNKGLDESLCEYIAFLDCDDYAYPSRLEEQLEFMGNNPDFGLIGSWVEVIDESGNLTGEVWKYVEPYHKIPSIMLFQNYFAQSAVFIRKSALCGNLYKSQRAEDYDLWVRIARKFKVGNIQKVLIKYRVHSNSRSQKAVDEIEINVCNIVSKQLNDLGIKPTAKDLALHRQLAVYNYNDIDTSLEFIKEVGDWLIVLRNANTKIGVYQNDGFNEVLADIQFSIFCRCLEGEKLKLKNIQSELEQKQNQIKIQQNELEECKSWIKELQNGKDWLESQYYIWMQAAQDKQSELEQSQSQLQGKQSELEQSQSQLQGKQSELEQSQSQLQGKQSELEQSQSQLQECKSWIKELQNGKDWLESQYYIWMQAAQDKQSELEQSQSQLQGKQSELEQSQSQLQGKQSELEILQEKLQYIQDQITQFQSSKFWTMRIKWLKLKLFLRI